MKFKNNKWFSGLAVLALVVGSVMAASFRSSSFMRTDGSGVTWFVAGTNGATFAYSDSWNTNRVYVFNNTAGTAISTNVPAATNSYGAITPSFEKPVTVIADSTGQVNTNAALSIDYQYGLDYTNTVRLDFIRSADGGTTYDTATPFAVTVSKNGVSTRQTIITNLPVHVFPGTSHLKLWRVVLGTNTAPVEQLDVRLHDVRLSTFAP